MAEQLEVILRSIGSFCILLIGAKILGKQIIAKMTTYDFVAFISIGSIAANLAFNTSLKFYNLLISYAIMIAILFVAAYVSMKGITVRRFLAGNPTVVIENGKILEENMKKMRYTLDYLNQQLREKDIFEISEVLFAIVETNGALSVQKKPHFRHATKQDMGIFTTPESKLPIELIMDGHIVETNLKENNLTHNWLQVEIQKRGLSVKEVFYAVLATNGAVYIDTYKDHIESPIDKE
ncbi:DUF421 domain-containing protein [Oceanobacillus chungangensis]|uniref:DUF421 domain-containing protein n=1 Tax=Oceanobacillus chungangensis TaxID=1229152 RepID=A0A3D8PU82_9BACI|nr:DUF421 domain-containing protein [Oceanobacillus chungangensis]RDW18861.1 hypothetical protein CWR45_08575 [Oceanobacillus chungangensis]